MDAETLSNMISFGCPGLALIGAGITYLIVKHPPKREYQPRESRPWNNTTIQDVDVISDSRMEGSLTVDGDRKAISFGRKRVK